MAEKLAPLHYYRWHWKDWRANRRVQRMTYIERGLYRELLDECWAEGGIPDDVEALADICGCPVEVMADAWHVLGKCFEVSSSGLLVNSRLDSERTAKDAERVVRKVAGSAGGKKKALHSNDIEADASTSQASASTCHIEEKRREREEKRREEKKQPASLTAADLISRGIDEQVARDFLVVRSKKKAPLTVTALKGIEREAMKAGIPLAQALATCAVRGWAGFNAEWVKQQNGQPHRSSIHEQRAATLAGLTGQGQHNQFTDSDFDVIEGTAKQVD